jgi:hypothetical protein
VVGEEEEQGRGEVIQILIGLGEWSGLEGATNGGFQERRDIVLSTFCHKKDIQTNEIEDKAQKLTFTSIVN